MFVIGCSDLIIATDHKPLVKILGDRNMDNIKNPRLFSIKERTLQFDYQIKHVPGAGHHAPDAFSRHRRPNHTSSITCLHEPASEEEYDISSITCAFAEVHSYSAVNALNGIDGAAKTVTITWIKDAASHDQTYCELLQLCQSGFPRNSSQLPKHLTAFLEDSQRPLKCRTTC